MVKISNISNSKRMYEILAKLHADVFPVFFLSTLGLNFLTTYYKVVLKHPETICFFATDENENILGYVLGRSHASGYLKRILMSAPLTFMLEGLKLLFTRPKSLLRLIRNLDKKNNDGSEKDTQNYAEIGLIGVIPEAKGKGIGHQLLREFEKELKKRNVKQLSLTTDYENNENTLRAYHAWGFEVLYIFTTYPNRKMYRLIKDIK